MNKKRNWIIGIAFVLIIAFAITGVIFYFNMKPYLLLKQNINNLLNKEYEYKVDCYVDGMDLKLLGDSFQGTIEGEKGQSVIYGDIKYNDVTYLKIYADKDDDIIFDAEPLVTSVLDSISENIIFGDILFGSIKGDVKISYDQIESVLNKDITSVSDNGVSNELMKELSKGERDSYIVTLLKAKDVEEKDKLLGDDAYYFDIALKNYDTRLVMGIPKDKNNNRISVNIYTDKVTWSFVGDYTYKAVDDIEMPESTISDKTIDTLRMLYSTYLDLMQ